MKLELSIVDGYRIRHASIQIWWSHNQIIWLLNTIMVHCGCPVLAGCPWIAFSPGSGHWCPEGLWVCAGCRQQLPWLWSDIVINACSLVPSVLWSISTQSVPCCLHACKYWSNSDQWNGFNRDWGIFHFTGYFLADSYFSIYSVEKKSLTNVTI